MPTKQGNVFVHIDREQETVTVIVEDRGLEEEQLRFGPVPFGLVLPMAAAMQMLGRSLGLRESDYLLAAAEVKSFRDLDEAREYARSIQMPSKKAVSH